MLATPMASFTTSMHMASMSTNGIFRPETCRTFCLYAQPLGDHVCLLTYGISDSSYYQHPISRYHDDYESLYSERMDANIRPMSAAKHLFLRMPRPSSGERAVLRNKHLGNQLQLPATCKDLGQDHCRGKLPRLQTSVDRRFNHQLGFGYCYRGSPAKDHLAFANVYKKENWYSAGVYFWCNVCSIPTLSSRITPFQRVLTHMVMIVYALVQPDDLLRESTISNAMRTSTTNPGSQSGVTPR